MRSIKELASEICTLTGHMNAANHRWLMLIGEFDRRTGWSDGATQSCAHWLNWKCGIAIGDAGTEDYLLMIAEHGTAQHVENLVRAYRRCKEAEELSREARQQQNRSVKYRYDDDGSLILNCRLPAEAGVRLMKAIDLAVDEQLADEKKNVPAGTSPPREFFSVRRADALAVIAESFLAHGVMEAAGGGLHAAARRCHSNADGNLQGLLEG